MRSFDYKKQCDELLTPEIVALLTQIHEYKGEYNRYITTKKDILERLVDVSIIQSTDASNKIEGIYTSDERLKKLVLSKTTPKNRSEQEIAGYRDVLSNIHENYDHIPIIPSMILERHRELYKYEGIGIGGTYKIDNNIIEEIDEFGNRIVRFKPVEYWEVPSAMEEICKQYNENVNFNKVDPLLAISIFIFDFLCIHPFSDGNGRMSRLLTLLMLYKSNYIIGKYISIEKLIEQTKCMYYYVLKESSNNWHEATNDYKPFVKYFLGIIVKAYREFEDRIKAIEESTSKPNQVTEIIKNTFGTITKKELLEMCPNMSQVTIQRTLMDLLKQNKIIKIGGGRYTAYTWNREID